MRNCLPVLLVGMLTFLLLRCVPEQEKFTYDTGISLRFSKDSVKFDTVLTSMGSITRRFKVYNDAERAVRISSIQLRGGSSSPFEIWVNGEAADSFDDITLLGKDSLLVLVEVLIDPEDKDQPYLVTDQVEFLTNENEQQVELVAYGQDAIFLNGNILACGTTWTAGKPYVIYNSVLVDSLCSLTIEAGTRVYSHINSYLLIKGNLQVNGTAENPVIFRNDRFEERYQEAPGQWGGLIFLDGSHDNAIDHARIVNAENGIYLGTPDDNDTPDLILSHSMIENIGGSETVPLEAIEIQPGFGILSFNSDLYAYDVLIDNCAVNTVGNYGGGNYRYEHCTFANYGYDFFRKDPSTVFADNVTFQDGTSVKAPLYLDIRNSIIWGSLADEVIISVNTPESGSLQIKNNIIRSRVYREDLQQAANLLEDPRFISPEIRNFQLDTLSPAKDSGLMLGIPDDLEGTPRDAQPDLGAFERIEN